jgi:hypothetical protein
VLSVPAAQVSATDVGDAGVACCKVGAVGGVVSIVQDATAGDGSAAPFTVENTEKVCLAEASAL